MKRTLAILLGLALMLGGVGMATAEGSQTFTFACSNDLTTLDVSLMNDEMSGLIQYAVNEGLIRHQEGGIVPGIAESWDISEDGLTYTFTLREAEWADGEPVTAGDFAYSFLRTIDPATGSSQVENFASIKGAAAFYGGEETDAATVGIEAVDDKTLVITLESPNPFFLEEMARSINHYPIREDYVQEYGAQYAADPGKYIGCGPFVLTEWVQTASITMEKNPAYWDAENIHLQTVTELIVADENTATGMYDLGEVDALYSISLTQTLNYPDYKSKDAGNTLQYLAFMSSGGSVLENQNLRLALSYGINRQAVATAVTSPGTTVMDRVILPAQTLEGESIAEQYPATNGVPAQGDMEKAMEYLGAAMAELGVDSVDALPAIRYVAMESATHKAMAEALQAQWAQNLGVKVDIDLRPVPQAIGALLSGDFDIFLVSQSAGVDPNSILNNFTIGNGNNYTKWESGEYTALIEAQMHEGDLEKRFTALSQAEQIILSSGTIAPLWAPGGAYVVQDTVQGLYFGPWTGGIEFNHVTIAE